MNLHNGEKPRATIGKNKRTLVRNEMTEEEINEVNLYAKWYRSKERRILQECKGIPLDELPEEYTEYRDKIATLRAYGLEERTTYEAIIEWLNLHENNLPRGNISSKGKQDGKLTIDELNETRLYQRWRNSPEREALEACIGIPIDELPEEYAEYKEQIQELRNHGLGLVEKTVFEKMVDWFKEHEGKMPKASYSKNGKRLKLNELTEAQQEEVRLYSLWQSSELRKVFDACKRDRY